MALSEELDILVLWLLMEREGKVTGLAAHLRQLTMTDENTTRVLFSKYCAPNRAFSK